MSDIHSEFEKHLAHWRARYASQPDREMMRLFLLALEREENVSVAYGERFLGRRLTAMPLGSPVSCSGAECPSSRIGRAEKATEQIERSDRGSASWQSWSGNSFAFDLI